MSVILALLILAWLALSLCRTKNKGNDFYTVCAEINRRDINNNVLVWWRKGYSRGGGGPRG